MGKIWQQKKFKRGPAICHFKDQKKKVKKGIQTWIRFDENLQGILVGWDHYSHLLFETATKIFALAIVKEMLEWASNEENIIKLETFLMKTDYVFRKIYGFGEFLIKDNIVAGFESLFGSDETLLGRLRVLER